MWIRAIRPRTLSLSISGVILGSFLAISFGIFKIPILILALIVTLSLQILSNLANDYGDYSHGVDNIQRIGPERALQSGLISTSEMLFAISIFTSVAAISGLGLLIAGLGLVISFEMLIYIILGLMAILAAIGYTIGRSPYGYGGWGDLFVFSFFGIVATLGTFFLHTGNFYPNIIYPAAALGCLCAGVLNINNMRDSSMDRNSGKMTMAVYLGYKYARIYHSLLITSAIILSLVYLLVEKRMNASIFNYLFILVFPLFIKHLVDILKESDEKKLDPYLRKLAIATLLYSIVFGISMNV
ncbi:MAG: 1,4-dihydroxy-2-naphthoate octaprenyltransferase [Candidatus Neomarinimicrobiota bacterium]